MLTAATWENILETVKTIGFADVLDMVIIAYLLYKLIGLVRETRAGQLVKGVLLIIFLYLIADVFQMRVIYNVMGYVLQYGAVVLLVLFQPELRKMLEQVGRTKISRTIAGFQFGGGDKNEAHREKTLETINAICDGCATLSREKIGALMVIERNTRLGEIIDTGTIIDASPSPELIENIFFHNSPLHDGAMVIRDNRLYAAGCFLPLSENYSISRNLGTRHRAALGMSENSDAVVVVVSEETGAISVAMSSKLNLRLSVAELYSILKELFVEPEQQGGSDVKSFFRRAKK